LSTSRAPATQRSLEIGENPWFVCRAGVREALPADCGRAGDGGDAHQCPPCRCHGSAKCTEIVRAAHNASGASAVRRAGVLQSLLREASCLQHHMSANQVSHELTGRVRRGIDKLRRIER